MYIDVLKGLVLPCLVPINPSGKVLVHYQLGFDFLDYIQIQGLLCLDRNILPFGFLAFEVKTYDFIDE